MIVTSENVKVIGHCLLLLIVVEFVMFYYKVFYFMKVIFTNYFNQISEAVHVT